MANNNELINEKINNNSEKLDGFQDLVVMLNKTVTCLEVKVSKHEVSVLDCQDKVSQISNEAEKISTDYIKKKELQQLLQQQQVKELRI